MSAVYVNNLVINAGCDFTQTFTLQGIDTDSAFDLTNYTAESFIRKWSGSSSYVEFDANILFPGSSGQITLSLNSTQTGLLKPGRYIYDIVITDNIGTKSRVVEGMVLVREGATR